MSQIWIGIGAVIAVAAVISPLVAIVLVSIASRREESAHSLAGQAPGAITGAARRLLAYRGDRVAPASRRSAERPDRRPAGRQAAGTRPARSAGRPQPVWLIAGAQQAGQVPGTLSEPDLEVRFAYARRTLPDASQLPASRQPQPGSVRTYHREPAGV